MLQLRLLAITLALFSLVACKKDKTADSNTLKLDGHWNLKQINFLNEDDVQWNEAIGYYGTDSLMNRDSILNRRGYAPFIYSRMSGYEFYQNPVETGKRVIVKQWFSNFDETVDYWYWNHLDGGQDFEIIQFGNVPFYDFSVYSATNIKISDNGNTLEFDAIVKTRIGGPQGDDVDTPVEMIWKREIIDNDVELLLLGEPFKFPEE